MTITTSKALPKNITTDKEFYEVLDRMIIGAGKIDKLRFELKDPLKTPSEEKKQELAKLENAYNLMDWLIDDYKRRHPHFAHARTIEQLRGVL